MDLRSRFGALKSRLMALNVHDAVLQLTEGSCDLLIAYHHPSQLLQLSPEALRDVQPGARDARSTRATTPASRCSACPAPAHKVPYLGYGEGATWAVWSR